MIATELLTVWNQKFHKSQPLVPTLNNDQSNQDINHHILKQRFNSDVPSSTLTPMVYGTPVIKPLFFKSANKSHSEPLEPSTRPYVFLTSISILSPHLRLPASLTFTFPNNNFVCITFPDALYMSYQLQPPWFGHRFVSLRNRYSTNSFSARQHVPGPVRVWRKKIRIWRRVTKQNNHEYNQITFISSFFHLFF